MSWVTSFSTDVRSNHVQINKDDWINPFNSGVLSTKVYSDEVKQRKQNLKKYNTISFYTKEND